MSLERGFVERKRKNGVGWSVIYWIDEDVKPHSNFVSLSFTGTRVSGSHPLT